MSYRHDWEDVKRYNTQYTKLGDKVQLIRRYCKCGHAMNFVKHKPSICNHCGRLVYPDPRDEFMEKLKRKLKNEICVKV